MKNLLVKNLLVGILVLITIVGCGNLISVGDENTNNIANDFMKK